MRWAIIAIINYNYTSITPGRDGKEVEGPVFTGLFWLLTLITVYNSTDHVSLQIPSVNSWCNHHLVCIERRSFVSAYYRSHSVDTMITVNHNILTSQFSHSPSSTNSVDLLKILNKHQVSKAQDAGNKSWLSKFLSLSSSDSAKDTKELDEILTRGNDLQVSNDFKNALYYIDIQNKFPTAQQFKLIFDYLDKDPKNPATYEAVFPKLIRKNNNQLVLPESKILKELALKPFSEISPGYFNVPLVIDWQKCKLRNEVVGLADIVDEYK